MKKKHDDGPETLTIEEEREELSRIRASAIRWLRDCVRERTPAGTGAARTALICTGDELERLERLDADNIAKRGVNILINGFDPSKLEFGSNCSCHHRKDAEGEDVQQ